MANTELSKSEKTKQFIIEKVAPIFNKKGYAGTSISDITKATGLTKGCFYGRFYNKDEIAIEAFKHNMKFTANAFKDAMNKANSNFDKLLVYPKTLKNIYKTLFNNGGCPLANTLVEADDTHNELNKLAIEVIKMWRDNIILLINKCVETGEVRNNVNPDKIADLIISLIEGGSVLSKATGEVSYFMNSIQHIEELIYSIKID